MNNTSGSKKSIRGIFIIVCIVLLVVLIVYGLILFLSSGKEKKESNNNNESEKEEIVGDTISDVIALKNIPIEFKDESSSDLYYTFYYDDGHALKEDSCTADISLKEVDTIDDEIHKYDGVIDEVKTVKKNGIQWKHFNLDKQVTDPNTNQSFQIKYHIYVASIKGKIISIS